MVLRRLAHKLQQTSDSQTATALSDYKFILIYIYFIYIYVYIYNLCLYVSPVFVFDFETLFCDNRIGWNINWKGIMNILQTSLHFPNDFYGWCKLFYRWCKFFHRWCKKFSQMVPNNKRDFFGLFGLSIKFPGC